MRWNITEVPYELGKSARIEALSRGQTLREFVIESVQRCLSKPYSRDSEEAKSEFPQALTTSTGRKKPPRKTTTDSTDTGRPNVEILPVEPVWSVTVDKDKVQELLSMRESFKEWDTCPRCREHLKIEGKSSRALCSVNPEGHGEYPVLEYKRYEI